jgi:hypothetical protein
VPPLNLPQGDARAARWSKPRGRGAAAGFGPPDLVDDLVAALEDLLHIYVDPEGTYGSLTERAVIENAVSALERAKRQVRP